MNKQRIFAFVVGISAAIFGILYPEYVLLPDTYEYIIQEKSCLEEIETDANQQSDYDSLKQMLFADPEHIVISSYFWEHLADKGIVLWKNVK